MATNKSAKKTAVKAPVKATPPKPAAKPPRKKATPLVSDLSGEQLVVENLSTLSCLVGTLSETLDILVQKGMML